MNKQHRQYVILIVVLLACAASVFFGVKSILRSNDEMTTFAVGDWEGITLPRYHGPAVYSTPAQQGGMVTLPMTSTSSRSLFHHNAAYTYRAGVTTTRQTQTSYLAYKVHQTSDQTVRSIGSGNGSAGGASMGTTNYSSSSGASYSMPSVALTLPSVRARTLANNNIISATTASTPSILADAGTPASLRMTGIRRALPTDPEEGQVYQDDETGLWYWYDSEGGWIQAETKIEGGKVYVWDSTNNKWVFVGDQAEPDSPIGDIPWLMLLIAAAAFGTYRVVKQKKQK